MNTRNLTDFKQGTVVLYKYPNGYLVPGVVVGFIVRISVFNGMMQR